jgi:signal transduction histidine kinase
MASSILFCLLNIFYLLQGEFKVYQYPIAISFLLFTLMPFLIKFSNRKYKWTQSVFILILNVLVVLRVVNSGGIYSPLVLGFVFLIVFSYFFVNTKTTIILFFLSVCELSLIMHYSEQINFIFENKESFVFKFMAQMTFILLISLSIIVDRLERNRIKKIIKDYKVEKRKSDKLLKFGQVSAGISHELNNYLSIIGINLEVLKFKYAKDNEDMTKRLFLIKKNINAIEETVSSLRYLHHPDFYKSLQGESLEEIFEPINEKYSKIVDFDSIPNLKIKANKVLIRKVLINLLNNSLQAIAELEDQWVKVSFEVNGLDLKIIVTDSGKGIPKENQEKIFESFFTTKDVKKGSGIGLDLSRTIMGKHQGTLHLNKKSPNTQFIVGLKLEN